MRNFETHIIGAVEALSFTEGQFEGIIFSYSKVQLIEQNDKLLIKFEYVVHENPYDFFDVQEFEKEISETLTDLVHEGLAKNTLIYTGGTD